MPRGKKTPPEVVYDIIASWAVTDNYQETADNLELPRETVRDVVEAHKDKPEFAELRRKIRGEFSTSAGRIMKKAMSRLEREIDNEDKDIPVNQLVAIVDKLYDKKALADGKPTERTEIIGGDKLSKLAELAGYERKQ